MTHLPVRIAGGLMFILLMLLLPAWICAQEKGDPRRLLTVWAGMLPIILSAPHGGREAIPGVGPRRGVGVSQFISERDSNTAELAEKIGAKLEQTFHARPFLVVARFERKYLDANRPRHAAYEAPEATPYYDAYHQEVQFACQRVRGNWGGGILLDIHGQGAEVDTIFRGTDNGKSVSVLQQKFGKDALTGPKSILGWLASKGYKVLPNGIGDGREQRYTGGYTTQTYGSHRGTQVDAIQLELGSNLRTRKNLDRTAGDLADAIAIFAIEYLHLSSLPRKAAG
jgi:N-formylglutamate amidohydrolase